MTFSHPDWRDLTDAWLIRESDVISWAWPELLVQHLEEECASRHAAFGQTLRDLSWRSVAEEVTMLRMEAACTRLGLDPVETVGHVRATWQAQLEHRAHLTDLWLSGWLPWWSRLASVRVTAEPLGRMILRQERRAQPGPGSWPPPNPSKEPNPS